LASSTAQRHPLRSLALPDAIVAEGRSAIVWRWVLSRAVTLSILTFETGVTGDVAYYARSLNLLFHGGTLRDTLQEYPLPVLALLVPQYLLGAFNQVAFTVIFVVSMLAVDAIFAGYLWRGDGRRRGDATNLWLWFVPLVGPMAYFRFDLVPAVLAGGAVLVAVRRPALAGALTAVGAALKLWPAVMMPTFLIRRTDRKQVLIGFCSTGLILGGLALGLGGIGRTMSPLHWQAARGLQIESVLATPLMFCRMVDATPWDLHVSPFKSYEIFGPGVSAFIKLSSIATIVGGLTLVLLWWRATKSKNTSAETLGWVFLSTALIVTITNKTLSPQYLLWIGGPIAALAVRSPANHAVRTFGRVLLVTALFTQLLFPIVYHLLVTETPAMPVATLVLMTRNGLLVWLTGYAIRQVWLHTRPAEKTQPAQTQLPQT
jgi:hypothetical protein